MKARTKLVIAVVTLAAIALTSVSGGAQARRRHHHHRHPGGGGGSGGVVAPPAPRDDLVSVNGRGGFAVDDGVQAFPLDVRATVGKVITDVNVTIHGIEHARLDDLDIKLVDPSGDGVLLLSDVGRGTTATGLDVTLDDRSPRSLPAEGPVVSGTYRPTNVAAGDFEGETLGRTLDTFNGRDPSGTWQLVVADDIPTASGGLDLWTIDIAVTDGTSGPDPDVSFPAPTCARPGGHHFDGAGGAVAFAPQTGTSTIQVSGLDNCRVTGVGVAITGFEHASPQDVTFQLGHTASVVLMSDCGGSAPVSTLLVAFSEDTGRPSVPVGGLPRLGVFEPTRCPIVQRGRLDTTPSTNLSDFHGRPANGTWALAFEDDAQNTKSGNFGAWSLEIVVE